MKLYKQRAFSLTELLIVLVVIAILFAAMAPILTKRRDGSNIAGEEVWNYVNDDRNKDVFFDPGMKNWTSSAIIGYTPDKVESPYAKVVVKAKPKQRMIQFRYGSGNGTASGSLYMDDKYNIMMGSDNNDFVNTSFSGSTEGITIAGFGAYNNYKYGYHYASLLGANTLRRSDVGGVGSAQYPCYGIFAGNSAGRNINQCILDTTTVTDSEGNSKLVTISDPPLYIGSEAGQASKPHSQTIGLGGLSLASSAYRPKQSVYVGYSTGGGAIQSGGLNVDSNEAYNKAMANVVVGSTFSGFRAAYDSSNKDSATLNSANYNTLLGYGVYSKGHPQARHMTVAGYGACDSIKGTTFASTDPTYQYLYDSAGRTCIGYKSATDFGTYGAPTTMNDAITKDGFDRVFLGGKPASGGFNGRAVLETHDVGGQFLSPEPRYYSNRSVVLNSNLVVRGGLYSAYYSNLVGYNPRDISVAFGTKVFSFNCKGDEWIGKCGVGYVCTNKFGVAGQKSASYLNGGTFCNNDISKYPSGGDCIDLKTSDIRLKDNITENNDGLAKILELKPYKYTFKSDKKKVPQVGVIAQDLQKVFPNSVKMSDDGYLHIRWDEMFYAMINAIKTLDKKVEKIASNISNMESDVRILKSNHKELQQKIASLNVRAAKLEKK